MTETSRRSALLVAALAGMAFTTSEGAQTSIKIGYATRHRCHTTALAPATSAMTSSSARRAATSASYH
jgi:hypothetical protein